MLETCRAGPGPVSLSVEKIRNFDQVQPPRSVLLAKITLFEDQILESCCLFSTLFEGPLSRGPALHAGNVQGRPWSC